MIIGDIPRRNAKLYPKKIGLKFEDQSYTFFEFNQRINRLANAFLHLGLNKGDRIGIFERNCPEFIELYFAIAKSGNVVVPISPRLSIDEFIFLMKDSGVKLLITGGEFIEMCRSCRDQLEQLEHIIVLGDMNSDELISYEKLISEMSATEPDTEVTENDLYLIMYTSGTTGRPKGVMSSHKNYMANTVNMTLELKIQHEDVTLLVMPLYHNGGLWPTLVHYYQGGRIILQRRFDETAVLRAIQEEKVTTFNLVPLMLMRLLEYENLQKYDLSSLRLIFYGGAPMPISVLRKALEYFGNRLMTGLGLTEASGGILFLQPDDLYIEGPEEKVRRLGSVGRDAINVVTRIVNEEGDDIKPGEIGEVIVKGDNVMSGYWNLPDETAKNIRNGWLYTGDLATTDDEGYVFIVDRAKDIIISGGENISSKEVEDVLYSHPGVMEAAVIGIPDERWGERVHAVVVLKREVKQTEESLIEHCKANLASFKKPKSIEFVNELPRNILGKVEKNRLKEKFWAGDSKKVH
jgi:acyl-CoA synthetase (AMP-forming)/AMP-acid ligase II